MRLPVTRLPAARLPAIRFFIIRTTLILLIFLLILLSLCACKAMSGEPAGKNNHETGNLTNDNPGTSPSDNRNLRTGLPKAKDSKSGPSEASNSKTRVPDNSPETKPSAEHSSESENPDPDGLSNTLMAWWFMRTEDHSQPSAQEEIDLKKYDAWYIKPDLAQGEKPVFLTFDCGYENGFTPGILDVLKKHKAPAAFFVCKHFIKEQPELVKRMKREGHVVGNHTANHICLPEADERKIREEIADNAAYMKEATGYDMDHFFRPPKGEYSERTLMITKNMGYTTVFWSLAYVDYDVNNQPGAGYVINHFKQYIHPGAIPLIHNISSSNAEALDTVLTNLEEEGYTFCSLNELKQ